MEKAVILGGLRSYIGVENGMYRHIPAECLGAGVLKKIGSGLEEKGIRETEIDFVIAGNAVGAGGNLTRLMLLEAGLSNQIPACTVDLQCGSGLESIALAAAKIQSGQADLVIAGGFESSSTAPRRGYQENHPDYERYGGKEGWYRVAKFMPGEHREKAMLEGAERTAVSEKMTREMLDHWVIKSHTLAKKAREEGKLKKILIEAVKGCNRDEGIRDRMSQRLLDRLPCVLENGKVITAANSCLTHDGAAFVVLCSESFRKRHGLTAEMEFADAVQAGGDPLMSPKTATLAIEKLLKRNRLEERDIDIFECNEAFAVIDELFYRKYPSSMEKYNIFGGALAYGHPYGASGGILTLHAMEALKMVDGKFAVCGIAAAGGIGSAVLIKRVHPK